jgi:hypothetical protein
VLLLSALVLNASAADRRWNNGTGAFVFNTPGNWVGGGTAPGVLDVAQFGLSASPFQLTYTVNFNNSVTNQSLHIEDDLVTFDLNTHAYTLTTTTGMVIGNQAGGLSGQLTVIDGTINGTTNFDVGAAANTSGTLIVGANGLISGSPSLNIGKLPCSRARSTWVVREMARSMSSSAACCRTAAQPWSAPATCLRVPGPGSLTS